MKRSGNPYRVNQIPNVRQARPAPDGCGQDLVVRELVEDDADVPVVRERAIPVEAIALEE
jgi:hypothetical protein